MSAEVENTALIESKPEKEVEKSTTGTVEEIKKDEAGAATGDAPAAVKPLEKEEKVSVQKNVVHKANFENEVVYLYQFSRTPRLPSISSYCLKVESWLRLAGVKYENVDHKMKYRSSKGLLPFVELNGEEIADSAIIIKELSRKFNNDLDAGLSVEQRNLSHAMISMIENHLVWVMSWWRSKYPENIIKGYKVNLQHALGTRIPKGILNFIFKFAYSRKGMKKAKAHGIGVHKPEEINQFGQEDLKVLSDLLGDKPFFFGDEPTNLDVVAFSHLAQIYFLDKEVEWDLRDYMVESCPNLVGHVNRMKERCFPDWEDICNTLDLNSHLPKPDSGMKDEKETVKDEKEGVEKEKEEDIDNVEKEKEEAQEKDKAANKEKEENKQKEVTK